ncbi:UvrD-helicase domain-containing protein [Phytoactinopolyspora alkaliphila]|uniref:RecBCD enzyme subunit RecB n=1 Tax=Phytoactinopolyspora alkaliphila TaxID=1783498 RepID=A0A6N9YQ50_9ACTN|nr:UvrD-helicase domain-containing protein [Phytoactinopolyspora alkaliphila]NED97060.1 UvrD-helicase domain-containing protein [Phytoactinopolyspora alkaliphila]
MEPFDLFGPLPTGTTVLEASAGTGKTYALAGLVTRYIAEGEARLDEMLLITFGRAASQELRDRVRSQLVEAERALAEPSQPPDGALLGYLARGEAAEVSARHARLRDALANFDAATIVTTHQFCQLVLRSLGVAGDTDPGVTLVDDLGDLVAEVVDDLYLQRFGNSSERPPLTRTTALQIATKVVGNPHTRLVPELYAEGSPEGVRVEFAKAVLDELDRRKRRLGVLGYDDLLTRLAAALTDPGASARHRMRRRWSVVMVDEFQDTDPVQWKVIDAAFNGHSTLVLIGDPKQAIYAFRGGDIATYLTAAATAGERRTLGTNWRSDQPLVDSLQVVLGGAQLGHEDIVVHDVAARHQGSRLVAAPSNAPFRLRVVRRDQHRTGPDRTIGIDPLREHIARDLAADIGQLLSSGATYDGRTVRAGDVAVIVEAHKDARACRKALTEAGIPAVYSGDLDIFSSRAAQDWLCLLEAFDQPHRSGLVRAAATTMFFGETAASLHAGGEDLTDRIGQTLRTWADHLRVRGVGAVFEAARLSGMAERVLAWRGGERDMTDLAHLAQLLHETAHRERFGLPALLAWLRQESAGKGRTTERTRRLDSDAAAVQIMTVWVSKGMQFPLVYLPFSFNRHIFDDDLLLFHQDGVRSLDIGGKNGADYEANKKRWRAEVAGDDIRLTYVALTRAQSQVVAWWAPSWDEVNGGISRLLRGRKQGDPVVPESLDKAPSDDDVLVWLQRWQQAGGPVVEESVIADRVEPVHEEPSGGLAVASFTRGVDLAWRRTSYSALVRAADHQSGGVASEPEDRALEDEAVDPLPVSTTTSPDAVPSPMEGLPVGATFGSLVHAVLEVADPRAEDLHAELAGQIRDQLTLWPVDVSPEVLAEAMLPLHTTPLGPLVPGLTLGDVELSDRLRELDFEIPLAGGDDAIADDVRLGEVASVLRAHLAGNDPLLAYADRLGQPLLGRETLRGYLSGSIDVVIRVRHGDTHRFVVVDYKTNRLGDPEQADTSANYDRAHLASAMLHSDYPLQALLYSVVLHRYLRWRLPDYDPETHLGGVVYLYVRGMCGPDTPLTDGHPAGVFSWPLPPALVLALSDLLDGRTA